ncbi:PLDc N-terminal domain-containing protein [Microbispora sp. NPDC049125]|uniref:PLDc N-terminal domain-containing protein n=1 Tax=Microbispora sp. NPDC049125 TaxID=3154929 RepID=UPI003467C201
MPSVIIGLALLAFWLYCLFDVITTSEQEMRSLPKLLWVVIVLFLAALGGLLWLLFGRPREVVHHQAGSRGSPPDAHRRPRDIDHPRGPDDDPDFLRSLDRRLRDED